jgi:hypothetical protein
LRAPTDAENAAKRRHAHHVGEILWAWNDLNKTLGVLFSEALNHPNKLVGQVLWTTLTNDQSQREQLLALLVWNSSATTRDADRVRWLVKQVGELAPFRNDIVHGPTGYSIGSKGLSTRFTALGNSYKRWVRHHSIEVELAEMMALLLEDLEKLNKYAAQLQLEPVEKGRRAPRKPTLKLRAAMMPPPAPKPTKAAKQKVKARPRHP